MGNTYGIKSGGNKEDGGSGSVGIEVKLQLSLKVDPWTVDLPDGRKLRLDGFTITGYEKEEVEKARRVVNNFYRRMAELINQGKVDEAYRYAREFYTQLFGERGEGMVKLEEPVGPGYVPHLPGEVEIDIPIGGNEVEAEKVVGVGERMDLI